jgi:hypothetical protein
VLHLDPLEPRTPRLPHQRLGAVAQLAVSTALHVAFVLIAALLASTLGPGLDASRPEPITDLTRQDVRLVFLVSELPPTAGGGGGGGNQRPEPIRRAQGVGSDPITLRVAACCRARRQVRDPGAASAPEAGRASGRDAAPASGLDPAVEPAAASTARADPYPHRVSSRRSGPGTPATR